MARPGITFLDVKDAIAVLQGQEKTITVDHIREILGTGSRSTINNHLKTWRSQVSDVRLHDATLPAELISLIKGLWETMRDKANESITQHQTQCDEKIKDVEVTLKNQQNELTHSNQQLQETSTLLQHKTAHAEQLQTKLTLERQEIHKLNERIASLKTRRQDTVDENKKLHEHIKHLQNNLEHYQTTIQEQQHSQRLQQEKQQQDNKATIQSLQQHNAQLQLDHTALSTEHQLLQEQQRRLQQSYDELANTLKTTEKSLAQLQANHDTLAPKYEALDNELKTTHDLWVAKQLETERLQTQLSAQEQLNAQTAQQLQQIQQRYDTLQREQLHLHHQKKSDRHNK